MIEEQAGEWTITRDPSPTPRDPSDVSRQADTAIRAFFGDAERTFRLPPELIIELEGKTGAGIGLLCSRLFARQFSHADVQETIRLALIGGGTNAKEAATLVAAYAAKPLAEPYGLAVDILNALWFGAAATPGPIDG